MKDSIIIDKIDELTNLSIEMREKILLVKDLDIEKTEAYLATYQILITSNKIRSEVNILNSLLNYEMSGDLDKSFYVMDNSELVIKKGNGDYIGYKLPEVIDFTHQINLTMNILKDKKEEKIANISHKTTHEILDKMRDIRMSYTTLKKISRSSTIYCEYLLDISILRCRLAIDDFNCRIKNIK